MVVLTPSVVVEGHRAVFESAALVGTVTAAVYYICHVRRAPRMNRRAVTHSVFLPPSFRRREGEAGSFGGLGGRAQLSCSPRGCGHPKPISASLAAGTLPEEPWLLALPAQWDHPGRLGKAPGPRPWRTQV